MDDCPLFCKTCPMVPRGVQAVLVDAEVVTLADLLQYRFAREAPDFAKRLAGNTRISAEVVESDLPHIEVGDTAKLLVGAKGMEFHELKEEVRNCNGPIFTRLQRFFKFLGPRGRCGAMDNSKTIYLD